MKNVILLFFFSLPFFAAAQEHKDQVRVEKEAGELLAEIIKDDPAIENNLIIPEVEILDPIILSQSRELVVVKELNAMINVARNSHPAGKVLFHLQTVTDIMVTCVTVREKSSYLNLYCSGLDNEGKSLTVELLFLPDQSVIILTHESKLDIWSSITVRGASRYANESIEIPFHIDQNLIDVRFPMPTFTSRYEFLLTEMQILQIIAEEKGKMLTAK